jgi:hypothetical protein
MAASLRTRGEQYRNLIILWMRVQGLTVTGKIKFPTAAAAAAAIEISDSGHVWGLPLSIIVRDETKTDFSGALDQAEMAAHAAGKLAGAVVSRRAGREVEESYVTLSLSGFCILLNQMESHHG